MAKPEEVFLIGGPIILEEPQSGKRTAKISDKRHRRKSGCKISLLAYSSIGQWIHKLMRPMD